MSIGCVVQLDRISDFGSEGWGFESLRGHFMGQVFLLDLSQFFYTLISIINTRDFLFKAK